MTKRVLVFLRCKKNSIITSLIWPRFDLDLFGLHFDLNSNEEDSIHHSDIKWVNELVVSGWASIVLVISEFMSSLLQISPSAYILKTRHCKGDPNSWPSVINIISWPHTTDTIQVLIQDQCSSIASIASLLVKKVITSLESCFFTEVLNRGVARTGSEPVNPWTDNSLNRLAIKKVNFNEHACIYN